MSDVQKLLSELARAKATFQLRAIEAVMCADARSKPDQETRRASPGGEGER